MTYGNDAFRAGMRALALDAAQRAYNREMSSRVIVTPEVAAELERLSPIARPGGIVTLGDPCECDYCALMRGPQWTREQLDGFEGARRARIMAGVDMPGRIVDDVRPDQRGE